MANILIPPPTKPAVSEKKKRVVAEGRVITGADMLKQLKVCISVLM
ncbi:MAG: hypothetical protein ABW185_05075 [Sedimenticola sp.]